MKRYLPTIVPLVVSRLAKLATFFQSRAIFGVLFVFILVVLLLHVFQFSAIKIDNTALILMGLLLVTPLANSIRKFKGGGIEIELFDQEKKKLDQQSKRLAKKITPKKDKDDLEKNTELIQKQLDKAFKAGLRVGGFTAGKLDSIDNFQIYKDADGRELISWDES